MHGIDATQLNEERTSDVATMEIAYQRGIEFTQVFATYRGSRYLFNDEHGLWLRRKADGTLHTNEIYIGSLTENPSTTLDRLYKDLNQGRQRGLVPRFLKDNIPFGIHHPQRWLSMNDVEELGEGHFSLRGGLQQEVGIHWGDPITEITRDIDPRKYLQPRG